MDGIEVAVMVISFLALLSLGVPVAWTLGLTAMLTLLTTMDGLVAVGTVAQRMATGLDSFSLLAIPFFILAGQLMNRGGLARRLIDFAKALVGPLPGGLAAVNVVAAMLFGAIAGSAAAAASAIGSIMTKRMEDEGYPRPFSAAVNITSATTGLIIPPSNILIVYSLASGGVSIAALFVAGYVPGILTGLLLIVAAAIYARRKGYPNGEGWSAGLILRTFGGAMPSLLLLVVVIGGIVAGVFTATEASAVAVAYCLLLAFLYGEIKLKDLPEVFTESVNTTAIVLLLVSTSLALSWVMSYENLPQAITEGLLGISDNPIVILLLINLILLVVGIFMDMTPAVLIFTPIFLPVAIKLGMDPVHFGIMMVLNLCIGLCTPPVGTVLFVGVGVAQVKITQVLRPLMPLFLVMLLALLLVTFFPPLTLWLPDWLLE
ncbi:TRAP transporter large permease [Neolewinella lacunae]|uniref:TRAP transporter large permease n=1 Tax=Neolewinella lacunae TaxID=1517758 RepID=A0A923T728_9BACT|nr:TRAP transporter large permease [Neolewinella lacunae]MBC6993129.1 TRAP transporter large permease [Neolewinella lacunae]MDN3633137.1 TRAP transporter large permease [Neolewinella lacunae]